MCQDLLLQDVKYIFFRCICMMGKEKEIHSIEDKNTDFGMVRQGSES